MQKKKEEEKKKTRGRVVLTDNEAIAERDAGSEKLAEGLLREAKLQPSKERGDGSLDFSDWEGKVAKTAAGESKTEVMTKSEADSKTEALIKEREAEKKIEEFEEHLKVLVVTLGVCVIRTFEKERHLYDWLIRGHDDPEEFRKRYGTDCRGHYIGHIQLPNLEEKSAVEYTTRQVEGVMDLIKAKAKLDGPLHKRPTVMYRIRIDKDRQPHIHLSVAWPKFVPEPSA
jgi:hypothetical protein